MAASQSVNQNTYSQILRSGSAWVRIRTGNHKHPKSNIYEESQVFAYE